MELLVTGLCLVATAGWHGLPARPHHALMAMEKKQGRQPVAHAEPLALVQLAADHARKGDYAAAASTYDKLAERSIANGVFYLNQGNAHFLAGHVPQAILAYRRAERFIPNDPRLQANLAEARGHVLDPPATPGSSWPVPRLSRPLQIRLALAGYLLGWGLLAYWLFNRNRVVLFSGLVSLVLGLSLGAVAYWQYREDIERPVAVIAADGVVFRKGNGVSYPAQEMNEAPVKLNRGVEGRVRGERPNGWVQLELANGMIGWVPREKVLVDIGN